MVQEPTCGHSHPVEVHVPFQPVVPGYLSETRALFTLGELGLLAPVLIEFDTECPSSDTWRGMVKSPSRCPLPRAGEKWLAYDTLCRFFTSARKSDKQDLECIYCDQM